MIAKNSLLLSIYFIVHTCEIGAMAEIVTLSPSRWQEYRDVRLQSLIENPESFARTYQEDASLVQEEWQNRLAKAQVGKETYLFFAEIDGQLVGMIAAMIDQGHCMDHRAMILSFYVKEQYRNKNIGHQLFEHMLKTLENDPRILQVRLMVVTSLEPAIRLYELFGFQKIALLPKNQKLNGTFFDQYLMMNYFEK